MNRVKLSEELLGKVEEKTNKWSQVLIMIIIMLVVVVVCKLANQEEL